MKRTIITTADGSKTIQLEGWNEQYHSKHGAIQEAYHVFIKNGLMLFKDQEIAVLEMGFGTGLNALITCIESKELGQKIEYTGVESFPVVREEWSVLNYPSALDQPHTNNIFQKLHDAPWGTPESIADNFTLTKLQEDFKTVDFSNLFNLIYYDAFGARVQPDLWTEAIFKSMFKALKTNGVLVTYSAKGSVRRAMQAVGFTVERLPGPPGKREMLRASKSI
ncbi:MAG: tRNA (5-methylaminomethyl-2-thiouridine)(34)-methyltransferase MnmD [Croceitalea sp.]|nr:tRNA (5-methylaminomethyl-2-thiouridine)(34)-methyltransferase MnmD [Croceitalea sp.]NNL08620.1 tRNA (5-methylaminomethyl-2-thiouridine)(34)-methyltransferase MnmD [Croceitalea sp.]NNM19014.1 tRNA (5-methylaminomethyl-2-thiouridine)(34)-methyltransferase MnmD [Croceitalea sp.]